MAVDVYNKKKEQEDPMERAFKVASIGLGIANLGSKSGESAGQSEAMNRRLDQVKSENNDAMKSSIFSKDEYKMGRKKY